MVVSCAAAVERRCGDSNGRGYEQASLTLFCRLTVGGGGTARNGAMPQEDEGEEDCCHKHEPKQCRFQHARTRGLANVLRGTRLLGLTDKHSQFWGETLNVNSINVVYL